MEGNEEAPQEQNEKAPVVAPTDRRDTPGKSFNWRWMATHILPIFLVLIIGTVITIASVPSFRNSFNRFIAKWSPKADTLGSIERESNLFFSKVGIPSNELSARMSKAGFYIPPKSALITDKKNNLYLVYYSQKKEFYEISAAAISKDDGQTWSFVGKQEKTLASSQYSIFDGAAPAPDEGIYIFYTLGQYDCPESGVCSPNRMTAANYEFHRLYVSEHGTSDTTLISESGIGSSLPSIFSDLSSRMQLRTFSGSSYYFSNYDINGASSKTRFYKLSENDSNLVQQGYLATNVNRLDEGKVFSDSLGNIFCYSSNTIYKKDGDYFKELGKFVSGPSWTDPYWVSIKADKNNSLHLSIGIWNSQNSKNDLYYSKIPASELDFGVEGSKSFSWQQIDSFIPWSYDQDPSALFLSEDNQPSIFILSKKNMIERYVYESNQWYREELFPITINKDAPHGGYTGRIIYSGDNLDNVKIFNYISSKRGDGYGWINQYDLYFISTKITIDIDSKNPDYNSQDKNSKENWETTDTEVKAPADGKSRVRTTVKVSEKEKPVVGENVKITSEQSNVQIENLDSNQEIKTDSNGEAVVYAKSSEDGSGKIKVSYSKDGKTTEQSSDKKITFEAGQLESGLSLCTSVSGDPTEEQEPTANENKVSGYNPSKEGFVAGDTISCSNSEQLYIGDESTITQTISNKTSKDQENISAEITLPKFMEITKKDDNATAKDNVVTWTGLKISKGEEKTLSITIKSTNKNLPSDSKYSISSKIKYGSQEKDNEFSGTVVDGFEAPKLQVESVYRNDDAPKTYNHDKLEDKGEFEKTLPGDALAYSGSYVNISKQSLKNIEFIAHISWQSSDIFNYYATYKGQKIEGKLDNEKKRLSWTFAEIEPNQEVTFNYTTFLKKEISSDIQLVGSRMFIRDSQSKKTVAGDWVKRDLWGQIQGQITGPYSKITNELSNNDNKPVPGVMFGVYNKDDDLVIGRDVKKTEGHYITKLGRIEADSNGNYEFKYKREWFIKDYFKIKVSFDNSFDDVGNPSLGPDFPLEFHHSSGDIAYFSTVINISSLAKERKTTKDIKIRKDNSDPNWEYPTNPSVIEEIKIYSDVFANLYNARKIMKDKEIIFTTRKLTVETKTNDPNEGAHYKNNTITLNQRYSKLSGTRYPHTDLHEFVHFLQDDFKPKASLDDTCGNYTQDSVCIHKNHWGYVNNTTNDSFGEGMADFVASYLYNKIRSEYYKIADKIWNYYLYSLVNGTPTYTLLRMKPIFDIAQPQSDTTYYHFYYEDQLIANLLNHLVVGSPFNDEVTNSNKKMWWLNFIGDDAKKLAEYKISPLGANLEKVDTKMQALFAILIGYQPAHLKDFYDDYNKYIETKEGKDIFPNNINHYGLTFLDQLYVLFGIFEDKNGDWHYHPGVNAYDEKAEKIGTSGNGAEFKIDEKGTMFENITGIMTILPRPSRPDIIIPGSFVKINFVDKDGHAIEKNRLNIDIKYDVSSDLEKEYNYKSDFLVLNNETIYFTFPPDRISAKANVTVNDSSDSLIIDNETYWKMVNNSELKFDYIAEKTFHIGGGGSTGGGTTIIVPGNNNVGGGQNITTNVTGLDNAKEVTVYLDNKKIAKSPILSGSFGAKVKIPDTTSLGNHELRIEGDDGSSVSSSIKVTSNKWFNRTNYILMSLLVLLIIFGYFLYKTIKYQYFYNKLNQIG